MNRAAYWTLRLGAAACFIGHGAFGIITKEAWVPFFAFVGISRDWAFRLMPVVGAVDIVAGFSVLFAPRAAVLVYMTVWALWTALLRPLTGDAFAETLERAGNYGVPLALLLLAGIPRDWRASLRELPAAAPTHDPSGAIRVLAATTALLLLGHGLLAISGKPMLESHATFAGLSVQTLTLIGYAEIAAALLVVAWPSAPLLFGIVAWKVASEALFPLSGAPIWEFVERGGSYAAPLALAWLVLGHRQPVRLLTLRRTS